MNDEASEDDLEDRRFRALSTFLGVGMGYTPTRGQIVGALAAARRAVAVNRPREHLLKEWLQSEIRVRGIRENAAVLAVLEIAEFREGAAREYLREHPERSQALNGEHSAPPIGQSSEASHGHSRRQRHAT